MDYIKHIEDSIHWAELEVSKLTLEIINIHGITSNKVKCLLNNICNIDGATYLEIGVFRGSTFCSAIYGNNIKSIGIDNWSSPYLMPSGVSQKMNFYIKDKGNDPKEEFISNAKKFGKEGDVSVYRANYLTFDYTQIDPIDIVFYDGETKQYDQYQAIKNICPIMKDNCILIVDDWNWQKDTVYKALEDCNLQILHHKSIYTNGEDSKDFWNGVGIFLLGK
jgi:hypothetical protein